VSAPVSVHADTRAAPPELLAGPAGDRLWLALARVLRGLEHLDARQAAERTAAPDPAGHGWPLASAIDATTPAPSRPKATRAPLEDANRDVLTTRDI